MTWQIEHTITWDPAGDANAQALAAIKYFFDTWLPSKGWTTGPRPGDDLTSKNRIVQRNFTDIYTNTAAKHYLWFSFSSDNQWRQYEDATYTTTPGDLGTDTSVTAQICEWTSTTQTWGQKNIKFWGSTENNKSFMVTRWDEIIAWDPGINWPLIKPNDAIAATEAPNIDMWQSNLMLPCNRIFFGTNLPSSRSDANTYSNPWYMYVGPGMTSNVKGADGGLWDKVIFYMSSNSGIPTIWDQADVKLYLYGETSNVMTNSFMPVRVNNGNYWLFTRGSLGQTQMCFDLGTTLPDFN